MLRLARAEATLTVRPSQVTRLSLPEVAVDCPNCNEPVAAGTRACPSCGSNLRTPDGVAVLQRSERADGAGRTAVTAAVGGPGSGQLQPCPTCGADNSAARVLCARCGTDLVTGRPPGAMPSVHRPGPAEDVDGDVRPPRRIGRTVLVLTAIVVVGAAVGVVLGLLLADRGEAPERAEPEFDPAVYPGEPVPLEVTRVGASSERSFAEGAVTYDAANLVDGDVTTVWSHDPAVEAAADVNLALALAGPAWVTSLTFANGAQVDDLAFAADGRVLRLRLLVRGDAAAELQLLDEPGLQRVELPSPVLVETVRLVVLEAVAGDTYDEVSLSEIVVRGHPAQGEDLALLQDDDEDV